MTLLVLAMSASWACTWLVWLRVKENERRLSVQEENVERLLSRIEELERR